MNPTESPLKLILLLPIYNDWECLPILLARLDQSLAGQPCCVQVLIVDDGSDRPAPENLFLTELPRIARIDWLRLRRNIGHQRAIAIGLSHIHAEQECDAVLVMDADGEDKPEDAARLIQHWQASGRREVIFAARIRRSESWVFRMCYFAYRILHRALTGIPVRFGNFSIVPAEHLAALTVVSDTWNHYAASVLKARLPVASLPTGRGIRYLGQSKLNFVGLIAHGISAISVFAELVAVRVILVTLVLVGLAFLLLLSAVGVRLFTTLAIPGWATNVVGLLLIIVIQMLTVAVSLTLAIFFNRSSLNFLPVRDYRYFVGAVKTLYAREH